MGVVDAPRDGVILPLISIVTVSFNQARYLEEAILSVATQDYPAIDHIVVDPGSRDGSRDIIARHRDHIATVILEPDNGPADGLNKGFAAARGDIFGYINADDRMLPGALRRVAAHFAARPDLDAILGNGVLIDGNGRHLRRLWSSRFSLASYGHGAMTFCQQGHFFRRRAFAAAGGFNAANRTCWDGELLVDMALAGAVVENVPDVLGAFRLYGDTITGSGRLAEQTRRDMARLAEKCLGRPARPHDRLLRPLYRLARQIREPAGALEGLRARLSRR